MFLVSKVFLGALQVLGSLPATPAPVVELLVVFLSLVQFALVLSVPYVYHPGSLGEVLYVPALVLLPLLFVYEAEFDGENDGF